MKWFRFYPEVRTDDKLRTLTDSEHRVWLNLLCLSAEPPEERGTIKNKGNVWLAAKVAKAKLPLLARTLEKLEPLDIIRREDDKIIFIHFPERQYEYPSEEPKRVTERTRRHRQKVRNDDETGVKRGGNDKERAGTPPEIRTQSTELVPDPPTSDQPPSVRFVRATKRNEQVAAIVDLFRANGQSLTPKQRGHIPAVIGRYGHGQAVVDAAVLAAVKEQAGDRIELWEGYARNGTRKAQRGGARKGATVVSPEDIARVKRGDF